MEISTSLPNTSEILFELVNIFKFIQAGKQEKSIDGY